MINTRVFTTGVVMDGGKLLILRRKEDDDTYPGFWDCVGGHFEKGESAEECMLREAKEEAGQTMKIVKVGSLMEYLDDYGRAVAVPFLLKPEPHAKIILSEHSGFLWIRPSEIGRYQVVPDLLKALKIFGEARRPQRVRRERK